MKLYTKEIGLSLALCGVSMGTFIKPIIGINLVYPLMALSAILLFNYKILITGLTRIHRISHYKGMVIFLLLMVSYGFLYNDYPPFSNRNFLPMCFGVVICLELFTQDKKTIFKDFIPILYIISAFGCLMALYARTGGSWVITDTTDISDVTHDYNSNDEDSAVFLFGEIGLANLAANLNLETRNKFLRLSRPILGIISFLLVLTSGKRTVTILFFLYIILWAYNKYTWNEIKKKLYMIIPSVIFFIIVIIALSKLSFISTFFDSFEERFVNGVNIIFGGATYVYEDSASTRLYMRAKFYDIISSPEYSFLNMLFGKGWMTLYMDCPLLQSYLDMGIIGFLLFIYNYIIRILKNLIKDRRNMNPLYLYGCMIALNPLVCVYHAGIPYSQNYLIPVAIMILFKNISCRKIKENYLSSTHQ